MHVLRSLHPLVYSVADFTVAAKRFSVGAHNILKVGFEPGVVFLLYNWF